ncbi:response regulator transcription factor [Pseudomonas mosselii]|uniref:response regulator transcription factor n=1 Tax=Pseudomonas mosselii TaxID=78327 RepID=UPI0027DC6372|nr:helix-turn-helix transcriptional regulator [Pseudomonas mosselii]
MNITKREREVTHLLYRGMTNKQIGRLLGISPHTVRDHISSITNKLGVTHRIELILLLSTK